MSQPDRPFNLEAFSGPFHSESDRACAVLGAALVDERIRRLFERRLHSAARKLVKEGSALGNFGARIDLARGLFWISEDSYNDLHLVRKIRNKFAHSADHELSFECRDISDLCHKFLIAKTIIDANEELSVKSTKFSRIVILAMGDIYRPPRKRFEISVLLIAQYIDELCSESSSYSGPDLLREVRKIASQEPTIQITATVSTPSPG